MCLVPSSHSAWMDVAADSQNYLLDFAGVSVSARIWEMLFYGECLVFLVSAASSRQTRLCGRVRLELDWLLLWKWAAHISPPLYVTYFTFPLFHFFLLFPPKRVFAGAPSNL